MSGWQHRYGNVLHRKRARVVRLFRQPRVQIPGRQGINCSLLKTPVDRRSACQKSSRNKTPTNAQVPCREDPRHSTCVIIGFSTARTRQFPECIENSTCTGQVESTSGSPIHATDTFGASEENSFWDSWIPALGKWNLAGSRHFRATDSVWCQQ